MFQYDILDLNTRQSCQIGEPKSSPRQFHFPVPLPKLLPEVLRCDVFEEDLRCGVWQN